MKFRRKGPYKRNRAKALRRHCKAASSYTGTGATLNGRVGIIEGFTIYRSNQLIRDKRQFRRMRRTHGRTMRAAIEHGAKCMQEATDRDMMEWAIKKAASCV